MNDDTSVRNARRAADLFDDVVEIDAHPARRSTAPRFAVSRRILALGVAGALSVSALFAFAFTSRDDVDTAGESLDAAVPAAAASAAAAGFADRSQEVSRSAVRSNLSEAVADENAKQREAALGASVESATEAEWMTNSTERQRLMDEDLALVAAQSAKLKKEAEEAAKRLEEAKKAAAAAAAGKADLTSEDVSNLTTKGGSMPVKSNYRIGAGFGATGSWSRYHTGQDFPAPVGTPIYAAAAGVVLSPTAGGWAGINVVIQHSNGGSTLYAHMSRKVVSSGQTVKPGQLIGYVGNTGRSFGAHLHFEYYKPGVTPGDVYSASNPMAFLRSLGVS